MARNVIVNPITPDKIIDTIRTSKKRKNDLRQTITDFTITVPPISLVFFTLTVPQDRVSLIYKHTITSNFYDENLFLQAMTLDNTSELINFSSIALDSSKSLNMTKFYPFEIEIFWSFLNLTFIQADITVFLELINMEVSFYENWYRFLIENSERQLNQIVVSLGGDSRI